MVAERREIRHSLKFPVVTEANDERAGAVSVHPEHLRCICPRAFIRDGLMTVFRGEICPMKFLTGSEREADVCQCRCFYRHAEKSA